MRDDGSAAQKRTLHVLTSVNPATRRAVCSICGPGARVSPVKRPGRRRDGWRCLKGVYTNPNYIARQAKRTYRPNREAELRYENKLHRARRDAYALIETALFDMDVEAVQSTLGCDRMTAERIHGFIERDRNKYMAQRLRVEAMIEDYEGRNG